MGICKAYHHPEAVANILSFSQVKDLSHDIIYNQQYDEFILRFEMGVCSLTRRQNGLYVCDVLPEPHFESQDEFIILLIVYNIMAQVLKL